MRHAKAILLSLVVLMSVMSMGAGTVAGDNVEFDGESVDAADQVSNTTIWTGGEMENLTVSVTKSSVAADETGTMEFDAEASSVSSENSDVDVTLADDGMSADYEETASSSQSDVTFQVTFDVSYEEGGDGIVATEDNTAESYTELVNLSDGADTHDYIVVDEDEVWDVSYSDNVEDGAITDFEVGEEESLTINVERNDNYSNVALSSATINLDLDTEAFDNISDETNTSDQNVTYQDMTAVGDYNRYEYSVDDADASEQYTFEFTAEPTETSSADAVEVVKDFDATGGQATSASVALDLGVVGDLGLMFYNADDVGLGAQILSGLGILGFLGAALMWRGRNDGLENLYGYAPASGALGYAGVLTGLLGTGMLVDAAVGTGTIPFVDMGFNYITGILTAVGAPEVSTLILGLVLVLIYGAMHKSSAV